MMELDPDRRLALAYAPAGARPALAALWRLDATLGAILAAGRDSLASRLRLAWWRESLERLDRAPPPAEPVLQGIAGHVLAAGVTGAALAAMVEGWETLLADEPLTDDSLAAYAAARGAALFRHSARLLAMPGHPVEPAGRRWALVDLARRSANRDEALAALAAAQTLPDDLLWPKRVRPLGMLAILAARDAARGGDDWEAQGSPARMMRMLRHRLTGN